MKTKNIKLVLTCGAIAVLGAMSLQGCSSSDDSSGGTSGSSSGGKGGTAAGGTSSGGKGGTAGTAGASTGGKGGAGTAGAGTAGSGTAGTGTGGKGGGGTGGAAGAGDVAGATNEGGAAGAASDVVHPSAAECTDFCALDATTCTAGNDAYVAPDDCQTDCLGYTLGDDSDPTRLIAKTGDNFACRAYHLQNAITNMATPALLTLHCGHTGKVSSACHN